MIDCECQVGKQRLLDDGDVMSDEHTALLVETHLSENENALVSVS